MLHRVKTVSIIGRRSFKTLLAVLISVAVMEYIFHDQPFFACIGAVVAVEKTMSKSFQAILIRNIGTIIGGIIGIIFSYITQNPFFLSFGIIPFIYINNIIGKKESIVAGAIVYFAVVYLNIGDASAVYGFRRIIGTLIGSLIGIGVNYFIFPPKDSLMEVK